MKAYGRLNIWVNLVHRLRQTANETKEFSGRPLDIELAWEEARPHLVQIRLAPAEPPVPKQNSWSGSGQQRLSAETKPQYELSFRQLVSSIIDDLTHEGSNADLRAFLNTRAQNEIGKLLDRVKNAEIPEAEAAFNRIKTIYEAQGNGAVSELILSRPVRRMNDKFHSVSLEPEFQSYSEALLKEIEVPYTNISSNDKEREGKYQEVAQLMNHFDRFRTLLRFRDVFKKHVLENELSRSAEKRDYERVMAILMDDSNRSQGLSKEIADLARKIMADATVEVLVTEDSVLEFRICAGNGVCSLTRNSYAPLGDLLFAKEVKINAEGSISLGKDAPPALISSGSGSYNSGQLQPNPALNQPPQYMKIDSGSLPSASEIARSPGKILILFAQYQHARGARDEDENTKKLLEDALDYRRENGFQGMALADWQTLFLMKAKSQTLGSEHVPLTKKLDSLLESDLPKELNEGHASSDAIMRPFSNSLNNRDNLDHKSIFNIQHDKQKALEVSFMERPQGHEKPFSMRISVAGRHFEIKGKTNVRALLTDDTPTARLVQQLDQIMHGKIAEKYGISTSGSTMECARTLVHLALKESQMGQAPAK